MSGVLQETFLNPHNINTNKLAGLSRDWMGGQKLLIKLCAFLRSYLMGGKTYMQNFQTKILGHFRRNICVFVYVRFSSAYFLLSTKFPEVLPGCPRIPWEHFVQICGLSACFRPQGKPVVWQDSRWNGLHDVP